MSEEENQPENSVDDPSGEPKKVRGKPFPKGKSGNPAGHPKGKPNITSRFKKNLERFAKMNLPPKLADGLSKQFPNLPSDMTIEEAEAVIVHAKMLQGEAWAYDRAHGKADQKIDLDARGSVTIKNRYDFSSMTPENIVALRTVLRELRRK